MDYNIITPKTQAEFDAYYTLRYDVMRKPIGLERGTEFNDDDDIAHHFMALHNKTSETLGVGRLHLTEAGVAQVRMMAVAASVRLMGVGKGLMQIMEAKALALGACTMFLEARLEAVPFYEALGYHIIGEGPLKFGILPHKNMEKDLR